MASCGELTFLEAAALAALMSGICIWLQVSLQYRRRNPKGLPLPPGPKRLPLVGNVLDVPTTDLWLKAADWKKIYGDLVYCEVLGQNLLFINTYETAMELLEKKAAIYSSRPFVPMVCDPDLEDWAWNVGLMPYGEQLRQARQSYHRHFQPRAVRDHWEMQTRAAQLMVNWMMKDPTGYQKHTRLSAGASIVSLTYGREDDEYIAMAETAVSMVGDATRPGAFLVNAFPSYNEARSDWFPGASFKRIAKQGKELSLKMRVGPYEATKAEHFSGKARPSLVTRMIDACLEEKGEISRADEYIITASAGAIYSAGVDTTVSLLQTFILAMVLNPDVQRRAQAEIDRLVGSERLPTMEDRLKLPYVEAVLCEVFRWNPVAPLGVPHCLTEDDEYNGYFIPRGTTVIANQWLMLHDAEEYEDPHLFIPERFLTANDDVKLPRHPRKVSFGFGRRMCPGRHLGENSLFIGMATMLATLDIARAVGPDGSLITPEVKFEVNIVSHPRPFRCSIQTRTRRAQELVKDAVESGR